MKKQLKWPKFTEQYEEVKDNSKNTHTLSPNERFWNPIDDFFAGIMAAIRHLHSTNRNLN